MKAILRIWSYMKGHPFMSILFALVPVMAGFAKELLGEEVLKRLIQTVTEGLSETRTLKFLLVLAVILVVVLGSLLLRWHKAATKREFEDLHRKRLVLFVSPDLEGFYGEYLIHLVRAAQEQADHETDFAILPYHHRDGACTPELVLSSLWSQLDPAGKLIDGVFIIPKAPHLKNNRQELIKFASNPKAPPLVTLDVYPDSEEVEAYPCFVGGDEKLGGKLAAQKAYEFLSEAAEQATELRVLVLVGSTSAWESQRVTSFENNLRELFPKSQIRIDKTEELDYDEHKACEKLMEMHHHFRLPNMEFLHPLTYHLMFGCSDAMALGAAKAVQNIRCSMPPPEVADNGVIILGYDGTKRMESTLDLGHPLLKSTVCVDIKGQAAFAVSVMRRLIQRRAQPPRFTLIAPRLWRAPR